MPSFNLTNKTLKYAASDLTVLDKAQALLTAMADYDPAAKQDANTGLVSIKALAAHVRGQRTPVTPAAPK